MPMTAGRLTRAEPPLLLALDVGTASARALLLDRRGRALGGGQPRGGHGRGPPHVLARPQGDGLLAGPSDAVLHVALSGEPPRRARAQAKAGRKRRPRP